MQSPLRPSLPPLVALHSDLWCLTYSLEDLLDMYDEARERYPDDQYYISELGNFHKRDHPLTGGAVIKQPQH